MFWPPSVVNLLTCVVYGVNSTEIPSSFCVLVTPEGTGHYYSATTQPINLISLSTYCIRIAVHIIKYTVKLVFVRIRDRHG